MGKIFLVDKHNKFYQTEILCLNQISAILLSYFKIKTKKETEHEWWKGFA